MALTPPPLPRPVRTMSQAAFDLAYAANIAWQTTHCEELDAYLLLLDGDHVGTSTTSLALSPGVKNLVIEPNKTFANGQTLLLARTSAPSLQMEGTVQSYNRVTGALTIDVGLVNGVGTFTDWTVSRVPSSAYGQPPGSRVLLSTINAVGAATVDIETTIDAIYDQYVIAYTGLVPSVDGANVYARFKQAGAYVVTSTYSYHSNNSLSSTAANTIATSVATAAAQIQVISNVGNASDESASGEIWLYLPASTAFRKLIRSIGVKMENTGVVGITDVSGTNSGVAAVTGIRLLGSSGNLTGTFHLYGIKK